MGVGGWGWGGGVVVGVFFFFFNDTATTEIYTLSLHDALPIWIGLFLAVFIGLAIRVVISVCLGIVGRVASKSKSEWDDKLVGALRGPVGNLGAVGRSEEHTSELQSLTNLVCRLLLEKKKKNKHEIKWFVS